MWLTIEIFQTLLKLFIQCACMTFCVQHYKSDTLPTVPCHVNPNPLNNKRSPLIKMSTNIRRQIFFQEKYWEYWAFSMNSVSPFDELLQERARQRFLWQVACIWKQSLHPEVLPFLCFYLCCHQCNHMLQV